MRPRPSESEKVLLDFSVLFVTEQYSCENMLLLCMTYTGRLGFFGIFFFLTMLCVRACLLLP